jgi:large subunit ribosomal protein L30
MARKKVERVQITLVRSPIGYSKRQKATLKALGLNKMHKTVTHADNEVIRGMINKVSHLVIIDQA